MLQDLVHSFVTLFVTADPIGLVPFFISLAGGRSTAERQKIALRASLVAGVILVAFAVLGNSIIAFFGISLEAFEVAGGLLLFVIGFRMVFASRDASAGAQTAGDDDAGMAIFPLATPLIAGPGAISATVLLATHADSGWGDRAGLIAMIVLLMALSYAAMMLAGTLDRHLGDLGRALIGRLTGIVLAALAVEFIVHGVTTIAGDIARAI